MLLTTSVNRAVARMHWIVDSDRATVDLAKRYAAEIEKSARELDRVDFAKVLKLLGPELAAALRDLGGTPAQRKSIGVEPRVKGRLAELRAARNAS